MRLAQRGDARGRPDIVPLRPGQEGRLKVRDCSNCVGYLRPPRRDNHDADGRFDTGDPARVDADGYVRITGCAKDLIRGGENIPVAEIEGLLFHHPGSRRPPLSRCRLRVWASGRVPASCPRKSKALVSVATMTAVLTEQKVARQ